MRSFGKPQHVASTLCEEAFGVDVVSVGLPLVAVEKLLFMVTALMPHPMMPMVEVPAARPRRRPQVNIFFMRADG
jgi:hypothetical protein